MLRPRIGSLRRLACSARPPGWLPLALSLAGGCRSADHPPVPTESAHAIARLVCETTAAAPGRAATLGVAFAVDPGWHLYANCRNDSGLPIAVELRGPQGFTIGPLQWPSPHRQVSPGGILDHVYEGEVLLLLPVEVPADATPGTIARFAGTVDWLVCGTGCIRGRQDLVLELPIVAHAAASGSPDEAAFASARERLPRAFEDGEVTARWTDDALALELEAVGATRVAFYPDTGCAALVDGIADGEAQGSKLTLRLEPSSRWRPVRGALEVWKAWGRSASGSTATGRRRKAPRGSGVRAPPASGCSAPSRRFAHSLPVPKNCNQPAYKEELEDENDDHACERLGGGDALPARLHGAVLVR